MKDTIYREDAIEAIQDAVCKQCKDRGNDAHGVMCSACRCDEAVCIIDALPSAEAVQGEWIECLAYNPDLDADVLYIECDQCGHRPYFSGSYRPKYCEECGARMTKGGGSE